MKATSRGTSSSAISASLPITRPAREAPPPEAQRGRASCFLQGFCAAAIAAARCMSAMAARRGAITAKARSSIMAPSDASRLAVCAPIRLSPAEVLGVLKPLGVDAALKALEAQASETSAAQKQLELALQRARYEAAHARRQYDAVDPANRLVAGELERRWNKSLEAIQQIEGEIAAMEAAKPSSLSEKEREQLMRLGADLELAWAHPAATSATRKRIVRAALSEIIVRIEGGFIEMVLHWQGGDHTALKIKRNPAGKHRWTVPEDTLTLIRELARLMPDRQIARLLNRAGKPTGRGNGWTQARVCSFRSHYGIAVHRESEWAERGEITLEAAAQIMDVSVMTALRMARLGFIKGRQVCYGAPWAFKAEDIAEYRAQNPRQRPLTADPAQQSLQFQ